MGGGVTAPSVFTGSDLNFSQSEISLFRVNLLSSAHRAGGVDVVGYSKCCITHTGSVSNSLHVSRVSLPSLKRRASPPSSRSGSDAVTKTLGGEAVSATPRARRARRAPPRSPAPSRGNSRSQPSRAWSPARAAATGSRGEASRRGSGGPATTAAATKGGPGGGGRRRGSPAVALARHPEAAGRGGLAKPWWAPSTAHVVRQATARPLFGV